MMTKADEAKARRRARILAAAAERGIQVEQLANGWRLRGPGVDLVCADLAVLRVEVDLRPGGG